MKINFLRFLSFLGIMVLLILILSKPEICKNSAIRGLFLSSRIIIPSLFPFMALLLFLMNNLNCYSKKIDFFTKPLFMLSGKMACIMIFSFLGGYPIGAKLLNETIIDKKSQNYASIMLNFCVNAGPAFIISAVGSAILGSKLLGVILFISHISSSIIILLFSRKKLKHCAVFDNTPISPVNVIDNFVNSVTNAAATTFSICGYIIFFSVITAYFDYLGQYFTIFRYISYILEVTTAVTKTQNIYLISFLLGFAGISVWFQIFNVAKNFKINFCHFILFRVLHGIMSSIITYFIIKISNISIATFSNNISFAYSPLYSNATLSISLFIMIMLFIISLFSKKDTRKIIEDVI